jgi:hypothetical protein
MFTMLASAAATDDDLVKASFLGEFHEGTHLDLVVGPRHGSL